MSYRRVAVLGRPFWAPRCVLHRARRPSDAFVRSGSNTGSLAIRATSRTLRAQNRWSCWPRRSAQRAKCSAARGSMGSKSAFPMAATRCRAKTSRRAFCPPRFRQELKPTTDCNKRVLRGGLTRVRILARGWKIAMLPPLLFSGVGVQYADKTLTCRDCNATFVFTSGEQEFYASRGFDNQPSRCPSCRTTRKAERSNSFGPASYASSGYRPRRVPGARCS